MDLERVSLAIEKPRPGRSDRLSMQRRLGIRSEAVRDLIRRRLLEGEATAGSGEMVASLTLP